jgi:hypothetical protein
MNCKTKATPEDDKSIEFANLLILWSQSYDLTENLTSSSYIMKSVKRISKLKEAREKQNNWIDSSEEFY